LAVTGTAGLWGAARGTRRALQQAKGNGGLQGTLAFGLQKCTVNSARNFHC